MAPGFDPKNPKAATGAAVKQRIGGCIGNRIESCAIGESEIICTGEGHHPADIHGGVRPKQESGRVHEEEVGVPEASGLNGAKDSSRDSPQSRDPGCWMWLGRSH